MIIPLLAAALVTAAPTARFALIVTYNGGPELSRPPLHYADDDGAKYFEVFAALDKPQNVELLTEFDNDSARLFPALAKFAKPPTLGEVQAAAASLAERVQAAKKQGYATELTFVFAGHGDVKGGKGFVSLKGSPLDGDGLTGLLQIVGADRSHVILDSCNSFFVLSPRGHGRRFATPADLSERLTRQMPNVGVFLSTNAEAEVFEWSELQSGVFSHAVRSGMLGAADANGDGVVSYEELASFVDTATKDVANPLFRPKVFARGPAGDDSAGLASASQGDTVPLTIDDPGDVRLSVRDAQGLRWIDAHKEAGTTLVLRLPPFLVAGGTIERIPSDRRIPRARVLLTDPAGTPLHLSQLGEGGPDVVARGDGDLLEALWESPFGPHAVVEWRKTRATQPAPVFGIDANETIRMRLLLAEIAQAGRQDRHITAGALLLGAAAMVGYGAFGAATSGESSAQNSLSLGISGAFAAALAVPAVVLLARRSAEERVYLQFVADLENDANDPEQVVAQTSAALDEIAERDRRGRVISRIVSVGTMALGGVILASGVALPSPLPIDEQTAEQVAAVELATTNVAYLREERVALGGLVILGGAFSLVYSFVAETPSERLVRLWRDDPDRLQLTGISVAPIASGKGATFALGGTF